MGRMVDKLLGLDEEDKGEGVVLVEVGFVL